MSELFRFIGRAFLIILTVVGICLILAVGGCVHAVSPNCRCVSLGKQDQPETTKSLTVSNDDPITIDDIKFN